MTIPDRINKLITQPLRRRKARKFYDKIIPCKKIRPDLFAQVDPDITNEHLRLWGRLGLPVSDIWLRFYSNISGIVDYRYLPEDLFIIKVERILNDCNRAGGEAEDKNQYSLYIEKEFQPRFIVRYIRGSFFDEDYRFMTDRQVNDVLSRDSGPLIGKVAVGSSGGHGVKGLVFRNNSYCDKNGVKMTADWMRANTVSYVIQERVEQCEFSAQFNPYSANTCRIITFRRPWDGHTYVVKAGMRFGASEEVYDNLSSGGVCVCIGTGGELSKVGRNWYHLKESDRHPTSGVVFEGLVHPYYKKMCEVACKYAARIPNFNMISWDMVADKDGSVKIIEVNERNQGTDWLQYDFGPFFGDDTEAVVDWCVRNQRLDNFRHFRS